MTANKEIFDRNRFSVGIYYKVEKWIEGKVYLIQGKAFSKIV
jgi:hypothetical protein